MSPDQRLDAMSNAASRSGKTIKYGQFNLQLGPTEVGSIMDPGHFHCPKTSKAAKSVWTCGHLGLVSTGLRRLGHRMAPPSRAAPLHRSAATGGPSRAPATLSLSRVCTDRCGLASDPGAGVIAPIQPRTT